MKRQKIVLIALTLLAVVLLAVLVAVLLTRCGHGGPAPSPTPTPAPTVDPHAGEVEVLDPEGGTMWVPEAPGLKVFGRTATDFNVTDQLPSYAGQGLTMRRGIDVSDHQQEIDWQAVADYGIDFAIIRCGYRSYSEGVLHEDTRFRENIEGALDAGLDVGIYFFSQATNVLEAAEEAIFTVRLIQEYDVTLPVFFDWENIGVEAARTDALDGETLTACCLEFCELVRAAGFEPGMYSYLNLAYFIYQLDKLQGITLWMGDPGTKPIFYFDHRFWQYSYTGSVPGIDVDVDLDAMYIRPGEDPTPTPAPTAVPTPTPVPMEDDAPPAPQDFSDNAVG